ncbi:helix-turn-helix domain-containing protein [Halobacillus shinanisalinarum]|nr:helix-turn-helix domain-containing protein [Halobacillus shinanisalinarum]
MKSLTLVTDKIIYDEVVRLLNQKESVMNIHRKTGLSRNTIYAIKDKLK